MKGRTINFKNITISLSAVVWLSVFAVLLFTGFYIARYRTEVNKEAEMIAANFHISSNYLENSEDNKEYDIYDWKDGFVVELYNYEKENIRNIAAENITYTVDCTNATYELVSASEQKLIAGSSGEQKIKIIPDGTGDVTVTVTTTSPFEKVLTAKFNLKGNITPEIFSDRKTDNGDYYLVTIESNQFSGEKTINYDADLIPDTTDPVMRNWVKGTEADGKITLEPYKTYQLIFFNPENKNCSFSIN